MIHQYYHGSISKNGNLLQIFFPVIFFLYSSYIYQGKKSLNCHYLIALVLFMEPKPTILYLHSNCSKMLIYSLRFQGDL